MEMEVTIKVTFNHDKELNLTEKEAKDLYYKLKQMFEPAATNVPYYPPGQRDWTSPVITWYDNGRIVPNTEKWRTGTGDAPAPRTPEVYCNDSKQPF